MRVINRDEFFSTLAHRALGSEEIFGSRFVRHQRSCGNVSHSINAGRLVRGIAADHSAAFLRGLLARMRKDFINLNVLELEHWKLSPYT